MVDFATLVLGAETAGLDKGVVSLDRITTSSGKAEAAVQSVGLSTQVTSAQMSAMVNQVTGVSQATSGATVATASWVNELNRQAQAFDQVRASVDPVFAASRRYESAQDQVNAAVRSGIVSQKEADRVLERLGSQYLTASGQVQAFAKSSGASAFQLGNITAQFNDIGVMMAAGQNPLQLALQQGTQLNQVFAQMGGGTNVLRGLGRAALSLISPLNLATLGIIAGGAALVQFAVEAFSAEDAASDFEDTLSGLEDIATALETSLDRLSLSQDELNEKFTFGAEKARLFIEAQAKIAVADSSDAMLANASAIAEATERFRVLEDATTQRAKNVIGRIQEQFEVGISAAFEFEEAFTSAVDAETADQSITALEQINALMREYSVETAKIPPELRTVLDQAIELALKKDEIAQAAGRVSDAVGTIGISLADALTAADQLAPVLAGILRDQERLDRALFRDRQSLLGAAVSAAEQLNADILKGIEDADTAIAKAQARAARSARSAASSRKRESREIERRLKAQEQALLRQVQQHVLIEESVKRTADFWAEVYEDVANNLDDLDDRLNGPAIDVARTFTEGLVSGDLDSAFKELGRKAGGEFIDTLFGEDGKSFGGAFTNITSGLQNIATNVQSAFGSIGSLLSGATGLSQAFAGVGNALQGIGGALGQIIPGLGAIIGGVTAVFQIIGAFSKTKVIGAGITGELGPDTEAFNFVRKKKSSFFGLKSSKSTKKDANLRATNVLSDARDIVLGEVEDLAGGIGGVARDISQITQKFRIDTRDMSTEEVERVLTAEIEKYQNRISLAALGTRKFTKLGETSAETLSRLSGALTTFNAVADLLGTQTLPESVRQASKAAELLESVGGASAFTTATNTYFSAFLSVEDQIRQLSKSLVTKAAEFGLDAADLDTRAELTALVGSQAANNAGARRQAEIISLAPLVDQIRQLEEASESAAATLAASQAAEAEALANAIASEADGLTRRLLQLQGDTEALRDLERAAIDASNLGILENIYMLQDQADAAAAASQAEQDLADARRDALGLVDGYEFATSYDQRRARADALAGRDVFFQYRSPAQDQNTAEIVALRKEFEVMSSAIRIVAANTGRTADNTADSVALAASA